MTSVLDDYILVPRKKAETETKELPTASVNQVSQCVSSKPLEVKKYEKPSIRLQDRVGLGSNVKMPQVGVWLTIAISATSGGAAAQAPVTGVIPGASLEFSSLAALYDEYKVTHGTADYYVTCSDPAQTNSIDCVTGYEPIRSTAFTSVINGLSVTQHLLTTTTGGLDIGPQPRTKTGFWNFKFKVPAGPSKSVAEGTDLATGEWSDVLDTTNLYGYVKSYVQAPSAGTTSVIGYLKMFTLFRCRH